MYYSINDKYKASQSSKNIFEDVNKDKRNFSTDEEKEIKEIAVFAVYADIIQKHILLDFSFFLLCDR